MQDINSPYYQYSTHGNSAIGDFIFGIICLFFAFPILWNNERKQVKIGELLTKGEKECRNITDVNNPSSENNFKLVYASGETSNHSATVDEHLHIKVENAVKLIRTVEMYQWTQHTTKHGHNTEYSYSKQWASYHINSNAFHNGGNGHQNPDTFPYQT